MNTNYRIPTRQVSNLFLLSRQTGFYPEGDSGLPMKNLQDVHNMIGFIKLRGGYNPHDWGKDKSFLSENAVKTWISFSNCSPNGLRREND